MAWMGRVRCGRIPHIQCCEGKTEKSPNTLGVWNEKKKEVKSDSKFIKKNLLSTFTWVTSQAAAVGSSAVCPF